MPINPRAGKKTRTTTFISMQICLYVSGIHLRQSKLGFIESGGKCS